MTMQFSVLASGSTGNAIFVESDGQSFLVDAGLSGKKMEELFSSIGKKIADLSGFLLHMNIVTILKDLVCWPENINCRCTPMKRRGGQWTD